MQLILELDTVGETALSAKSYSYICKCSVASDQWLWNENQESFLTAVLLLTSRNSEVDLTADS